METLHRHLVPPLERDDVLGLCASNMCAVILSQEASGRIRVEDRAAAENAAVSRVINALPDLANAMWRTISPDHSTVVTVIGVWWTRWHDELRQLIEAKDRSDWTPRQALLCSLYLCAWRDLFHESNELLGDAAAAMKLARKRQLDTTPATFSELAHEGASEHFVQSADGPTNLYWIDKHGKLRISKFALRDGAWTMSKVERDFTEDGVDPLKAARDDHDERENVFEQVAQADLAERAQEAIEAIRKSEAAEPGSPRWIVLEHAIELLHGEITVVALARDADVVPSTLSSAWQKVKSEIAVDLSRRGGAHFDGDGA